LACFAAEKAPYTLATAAGFPRENMERIDPPTLDDPADDQGSGGRGDGGTHVGEVVSSLQNGGPDEGLKPQQTSEMTEESESHSSESTTVFGAERQGT
jgi:hypothetical protein